MRKSAARLIMENMINFPRAQVNFVNKYCKDFTINIVESTKNIVKSTKHLNAEISCMIDYGKVDKFSNSCIRIKNWREFTRCHMICHGIKHNKQSHHKTNAFWLVIQILVNWYNSRILVNQIEITGKFFNFRGFQWVFETCCFCEYFLSVKYTQYIFARYSRLRVNSGMTNAKTALRVQNVCIWSTFLPL